MGKPHKMDGLEAKMVSEWSIYGYDMVNDGESCEYLGFPYMGGIQNGWFISWNIP